MTVARPSHTPVTAPATRRGGVRTQLVVVSGWTAAVTALAIILYPALSAALFALLVGLVIVVGLRRPSRAILLFAALAAATFAAADLAVTVVTADVRAAGLGPVGLLTHPAARRADVLGLVLLGAAILVASAALASGISRALARLSIVSGAARAQSPRPAPVEAPPSARTTVRDLDAGLRHAELEVARAAEYRREVTLALVGVDPPSREADAGGEAGRLVAMRLLDELMLANVTRFVAVIAYGPNERLMVLPEESAVSLSSAAGQLCDLATEHLGRQVRAALVSYPVHERSLPGLLSSLEIDLATGRSSRAVVLVGGVPMATGFDEAPLVPPEPALEELEPQALPLGFADGVDGEEVEAVVEDGDAGVYTSRGRDVSSEEMLVERPGAEEPAVEEHVAGAEELAADQPDLVEEYAGELAADEPTSDEEYAEPASPRPAA